MSLVIHTGNQTDLPAVPERFPRCGSWPCSTCKAQNARPTTAICDHAGAERQRKPWATMIVFVGIYLLLFVY